MKYSCLCFNKSVFNWTFRQLHYSRKNPIAQNYDLTVKLLVEGRRVSPAAEEEDGDDDRKLDGVADERQKDGLAGQVSTL
jgi:hypothetical protein